MTVKALIAYIKQTGIANPTLDIVFNNAGNWTAVRANVGKYDVGSDDPDMQDPGVFAPPFDLSGFTMLPLETADPPNRFFTVYQGGSLLRQVFTIDDTGNPVELSSLGISEGLLIRIMKVIP